MRDLESKEETVLGLMAAMAADPAKAQVVKVELVEIPLHLLMTS